MTKPRLQGSAQNFKKSLQAFTVVWSIFLVSSYLRATLAWQWKEKLLVRPGQAKIRVSKDLNISKFVKFLERNLATTTVTNRSALTGRRRQWGERLRIYWPGGQQCCAHCGLANAWIRPSSSTSRGPLRLRKKTWWRQPSQSFTWYIFMCKNWWQLSIKNNHWIQNPSVSDA